MSRIVSAVIVVAVGGHFVLVESCPAIGWTAPEGYRVVVIGTGGTVPVGAHVTSGDSVDLMAVYNDPRTKQESTNVIAQHVIVLALRHGNVDAYRGTNNWMALQVKSEQADLVEAADRAGALRVSLRMRFAEQQILPDEEVTDRGFGRWRDLGLKYLTERYPDIDPSRFGFHRLRAQDGAMVVVFFDKDSKTKEATPLMTYRTQYSVRMKLTGELIEIQQQDLSGDIKKIPPGLDQGP